MGKLVAAFVMFLAASALAIHEAKPPAPPPLVVDNGDYVDAADQCPDQPSNDRDDDGCPEPANRNTLIY